MCVEVGWAEAASPLSHQTLELSYDDADLGWVEPATLRVFEINLALGEFRLVDRSWVDTERQRVFAQVERPGTYAVIGLPTGETAFKAVCALHQAWATIRRERFRGGWTTLPEICQVILCAGDELGSAEASLPSGGLPGVPPGGTPGGICEACLGLNPAGGGLPEWHLPVKELDPCKVPFPKPPRLPGPLLYALLSDAYLITGRPRVGAAIEFVDPNGWVTLDAFPIGPRSAVSLAVAPKAELLYVLDRGTTPEIAVYSTSGGLVSTIPVLYADDIVISHDESTLYAAGGYGLQVIDTATRTVTQTISANGLSGIALSPDGATLAAPAAFYPPGANVPVVSVHLFDTQPSALRAAIPLSDPGVGGVNPVHPTSVVFAGNSRVVLWDDGRDSFYEVDVVAAAQDQAATWGLGYDGGGLVNWNNNLVYNASSHRAYALKAHHGEAGTPTWADPGELAELRIGQGAGTVQGAFAPGVALVPVADPGSDAVYMSVTTATLNAAPDVLVGFAPGVGIQPPIFTFATAGIPVRDMHFA